MVSFHVLIVNTHQYFINISNVADTNANEERMRLINVQEAVDTQAQLYKMKYSFARGILTKVVHFMSYHHSQFLQSTWIDKQWLKSTNGRH
jgi:hypothetical protein